MAAFSFSVGLAFSWPSGHGMPFHHSFHIPSRRIFNSLLSTSPIQTSFHSVPRKLRCFLLSTSLTSISLLVRFVAGPLCDLIGPRYTFALTLLAGAIPTALAGTISSVSGLLTIRFFVGILGGSFVPCQVWSTAFFDKNVVGTANALAGGWGNSGGGITYFVMPAIFDSLVRDRGLTEHVAWRVAFIVPFIVIVTTAGLMLLLCPDTPMGKWSERHMHVQEALAVHSVAGAAPQSGAVLDQKPSSDGSATPPGEEKTKHDFDHEAQLTEAQMLDVARGEIVEKPSFKEAARILLTPQVFGNSKSSPNI